MDKLTNPGYVSRLLASHDIRLRKKWGQNFLVDENVLDKIVAAANISDTDTVLEIGPGIGALTSRLAEKAKKVITIEIDNRLIDVLNETLAEYANVKIMQNDAMAVDYAELLSGADKIKLVANLPFNVATPLLYRWLKQYRTYFSLLVCMVQKEVAQRIVADPGSKNYGMLSVLCHYASTAELLFTVPETVFFPRPGVSSAVIRLQNLIPTVSREYEDTFYNVAEAAFSQRRKTVLNTLHTVFKLSKEELLKVGGEAGIDMARRGETLSVAEFAKLAHLIYNKLSN